MKQEDFLTLFFRYQPELSGMARSLLPNWDAVDDTLQESSIVMWRKIDQLRSPDEFLPWAMVILRFEALKQKRRFSRDRLVLSDELAGLLADEAADEEVETLQSEQAALKECLLGFSNEHQELLLAPYASDGKVKQLAEAAGRSPNSLYKLLGRLREKLHDCVRGRLAAS